MIFDIVNVLKLLGICVPSGLMVVRMATIHVLVIHHHLSVLSLTFIGTELPEGILILVLALLLI
jgi:hypothetical protein